MQGSFSSHIRNTMSSHDIIPVSTVQTTVQMNAPLDVFHVVDKGPPANATGEAIQKHNEQLEKIKGEMRVFHEKCRNRAGMNFPGDALFVEMIKDRFAYFDLWSRNYLHHCNLHERLRIDQQEQIFKHRDAPLLIFKDYTIKPTILFLLSRRIEILSLRDKDLTTLVQMCSKEVYPCFVPTGPDDIQLMQLQMLTVYGTYACQLFRHILSTVYSLGHGVQVRVLSCIAIVSSVSEPPVMYFVARRCS